MYTVRFRDVNAQTWTVIKNVVGDGPVPGVNARFFELDDGSRMEVPCSCIFVFSPERMQEIQAVHAQQVAS